MSLRFSSNFLQFERYQELSSTDTPLSSTDNFQPQTIITKERFLQEIKAMDTFLAQQVTLLVFILQDIVAQKHSPYLMDLLLRLNYNSFYRPI